MRKRTDVIEHGTARATTPSNTRPVLAHVTALPLHERLVLDGIRLEKRCNVDDEVCRVGLVQGEEPVNHQLAACIHTFAHACGFEDAWRS